MVKKYFVVALDFQDEPIDDTIVVEYMASEFLDSYGAAEKWIEGFFADGGDGKMGIRLVFIKG